MEAAKFDVPLQALMRCLAADTRSSSEIARLSGVSQPTVSRLRSSDGQRVRQSESFKKLCSFYDVGFPAQGRAHRYNELLCNAIVEAWDGSEEHGRALLHVVEGLKGLNRKPGRNPGGTHGHS
ncbi:helix-turn-helix domain-containing protein [Ralstonia solanacearum]